MISFIKSLLYSIFEEKGRQGKPQEYNGHNWKIDASSKTGICADCGDMITEDCKGKFFEKCEGWLDG